MESRNQFRDQVKSAADIVEIVRERVPSLKRSGATSSYKGICPFHTEKTPSFSVNGALQYYYCFGCQAKGDVFKFIQDIDHVPFPEALNSLAERYGIPIPKRSEYADRDSRLRDAIFRMNEIADRIFRSTFQGPQGADVRRYVTGRSVSLAHAEEFGMGLSDRGGNTVLHALQKEGFNSELLEESGLVKKREDGSGFYDVFRGRLMFPIQNDSGKTVGFAGRALAKDAVPKYVNSPETKIYKKSRLLYNLHRAKDAARRSGRFVLVEGYMDVIGLHAAGIHEGVASCGTALTNDQVRLMKRFAGSVVVNFDPDDGGSRGAEQSIERMQEENMRVRILQFEQDLDPDEYIQQFGVEKYLSLLDKAPNFYFWLADQLRKRHDRTTEGKMKVLEQLLPPIKKIPDKMERAAVAEDLAAFLGVEKGLVLEQFRKSALDQRAAAPVRTAPEVRSVERILIRALIHHPELRDEVIPQLKNNALVAEFRFRKTFEALAALHEMHPDFQYPDLEARLDETEAGLLSRLLFADEMHETEGVEETRQNVLACLRTLQDELRIALVSDLRQRIRDAEQRGDMSAALRLAEELNSLNKNLQSRENSPGRRRA
jgi:DNA primase